MNGYYGEAPVAIREIEIPEWTEFMHYLYLPVHIARTDPDWRYSKNTFFTVPARLEFLDAPLELAIQDAAEVLKEEEDDLYVYVTARRGFATTGNPLNRPGWHCDDFGGSDLNYIWTDKYPTRVLRSDKPLTIPEDDFLSMNAMDHYARKVGLNGGYYIDGWEVEKDLRLSIEEIPTNTLMRMTPWVVHTTPEIFEAGMRSFFKISVSTHRYDLVGNSHNYDLSYDWPMYDRQALRNQPGAFQNKDYSGVTP